MVLMQKGITMRLLVLLHMQRDETERPMDMPLIAKALEMRLRALVLTQKELII
jgi:hypothetical protein